MGYHNHQPLELLALPMSGVWFCTHKERGEWPAAEARRRRPRPGKRSVGNQDLSRQGSEVRLLEQFVLGYSSRPGLVGNPEPSQNSALP